MYYQETLHSRSQSMPESAYYPRAGARSRRNIVSMMSYDVPLHWRLREPLTVDCSVEYDLGASARVPKDSAPLLIIHPAYVSRTPSVKERRTPQNRSAPPVTRHASFVRRYPYEEDFRASMPDIRCPGARVCLKARLETAFADSGIPSSSAGTLPLSSSSGSSGSHELNRTIRVDSGIGSPSSSVLSPRESTVSSSGSSKKWRNGVSGLVTGFFCCSAVQPAPKNEAWSQPPPPTAHHVQQIASSSTPTQSTRSNINNSSILLHHHRQQTQRLSFPSSSNTSSSSGSCQIMGHPYHPQGVSSNAMGLKNNSSMSGLYPGGILKHQIPRRLGSTVVSAGRGNTCHRCRLSNSSVDCRDGFCSSIWNKENFIRPIQI